MTTAVDVVVVADFEAGPLGWRSDDFTPLDIGLMESMVLVSRERGGGRHAWLRRCLTNA